MRKDKQERHARFVELIEAVIQQGAVTQPYEFEGFQWAALPQHIWCEGVGVSDRTLRDLAKHLPIVSTRMKSPDGSQIVLYRIGGHPHASPRHIANHIAYLFRKKYAIKQIAKAEWGCLVGLSELWPNGLQVEIFRTVLEDFKTYMAGVRMADPNSPYAERYYVTRLATDKDFRAAQGQAGDLLMALCAKLAVSPKDRSADYLYCGATELDTALADRTAFAGLSFDEKLSIATADFEPLTRRAVAALSACTLSKGERLVLDEDATRKFAAEFARIPDTLLNSMIALTGRNSHPFGLMLALIWSQYDFTGGASGYSRPPMPPAEFAGRIPLYTYDKHTAVGKKAIAKLAEQSPSVRDVLARWVPRDQWAHVTLMAAFYADAAPVALKLDWFANELLRIEIMTTLSGGSSAGTRLMSDLVESRHSIAVQNTDENQGS